MTDDVKKTGNRLSDMEYDEVSLVPRGANQGAKVVLFKSDALEEIEKQCQSDHRSLKKRERCPECAMVSTGKQGKMRKASPIDKVWDILKSEDVPTEALDALDKAIHGEDDPGDTLDDGKPIIKEHTMPTGTKPTLPEAIDLSKLDGLSDEAKAAITKFQEDSTAAFNEVVKDAEELAEELEAATTADDEEDEDEDGETDVLKMAPEEIAKLDPVMQSIVKAAQDANTRAETAEGLAKAAEDRRTNDEMTTLAKSLTTHTATDNEKLSKALIAIKKNCDADTLTVIEETLRSANELAKTGTSVGGEHGADNAEDITKGDKDELTAEAEKLMKADSDLSLGEAIVKAAEDNPEMYQRYVESTRK